jgi:hypothetical protein
MLLWSALVVSDRGPGLFVPKPSCDAVRQWPEFARTMTRFRFFSTSFGSASSIQCGALTDSQMPGDQCRTNAFRSGSSATSPGGVHPV